VACGSLNYEVQHLKNLKTKKQLNALVVVSKWKITIINKDGKDSKDSNDNNDNNIVM
jgi:hypothetical protein